MWENTAIPEVTASILGRIYAQTDPWGSHGSAQRKLDKCYQQRDKHLRKATYKELGTDRRVRG